MDFNHGFQLQPPLSPKLNMGFTLLELVITIAIMGILITVVAPNFTRLLERVEQDRLEKELVGLFTQAKSEAALKNQDVYIHFYNLTKNFSQTDNWCVVLTAKEIITTCKPNNETIAKIDGRHFKRMKMKRADKYMKLHFDPVWVQPSFKHDEEFVDVLSFYSQDKNKVTSLRSHFMGSVGIYSY